MKNQIGSQMSSIANEVDKVRKELKRGPADTLLLQKPFAIGMYQFSMFMISYYVRVKKELQIDYDSFMIIQTTVSTNLYHLSKKKQDKTSYSDIEKEWDKNTENIQNASQIFNNFQIKSSTKLTISSICLVTGLPKETVRRKVNELVKRELLKISIKDGISLGPLYQKVFRAFVPQTTLEVSKLLKEWQKTGILKNLLKFKI